MPRKAATISEEPETTKKKTTKKADTTAVKKPAARKKAESSPEEAAPIETPGASRTEPPVSLDADVAGEKPKRAPRKKKSDEPAAAEALELPGLNEEAAPEPKRAKRQPKAKAASEESEPEAVEPEPPAAPEPRAAAVAPTPEPEPTSAPSAPQGGQARPRPLYIPREVEAFLRAAGLPIPTEKPQLDAILNAMNAAKMAAQQATAAIPPSGEARADAGQSGQRAPQQPGEHTGQHQARDDRHSRHRDHRDNRDRDRHRGDRDRDRNQDRDRDRDRERPPQSTEQPGGEGQPPREPEPLELVEAEGYCEIAGKGFGFIRDAKRYFQSHPNDVFVTPETVKKFGLRDGHWLKVEAKRSNRGMQIHRLISVNDQPPENVKTWPSFEDLTTISPIEHIRMETVPDRTTTRIIDLLTPIGKGQRGLIVAPPRTGKTTLLNHLAQAVVANHPDIKLMILLVDERPEEVTDFKRHIPQAELWASSNDMEVKSHTRIAQLALERARRLVESGQDVFILLDSITRLGRAFNNAIGGGGRTMSGGVDSRALETPRKIFAAARNTEEAGSLTIVATALIDTGSRMDELIFQEFKGTGNSEIVLDRKISDQRIYPAIDIFQSGTRREELLLPADSLHKIGLIRRGLAGHKPQEAIERVLSFLKRFPTNAQLLKEIPG